MQLTWSEDENIVQLPTPKTPRHRDAPSKRVPVTPRHRVGLVGKPLTPHTTSTPSTPSILPTVYNCARQLFTRSANPGRLVGREEERTELHTFIEEGIKSKSGRCLYVSGPPGTGKSALVSEVCRDIQGIEGVKTAYINCMSTKCSKDIYGKLTRELDGHDDEVDCDEMEHLRAMLFPKRKPSADVYMVILDEIDHLLTLDPEMLYTLFQWSLQRSSRLILIGIANALDLTDRFLPRLKARNLKPQLLPFLPYTAPQITSVIATKLKSLSPDPTTPVDYLPFVHPAAIQLCSRKAASQSGDLRKAFDIMRRTIDLIEIETKQKHQSDLAAKALQSSPSKTPLSENPNLSFPKHKSLSITASLATLTPLTAPRATIAHVSRVSAAALSNGISERLQKLNLQQKAALCALIYHQKATRKASSIFSTPSRLSHAPSVRKLYETYCTLCKREGALHPLSNTEFVDVLGGLETLGLLGEENCGRGISGKEGTPTRKGKKVGEEKRFVSFVDEEEVKSCLGGVSGGILRCLLGSE